MMPAATTSLDKSSEGWSFWNITAKAHLNEAIAEQQQDHALARLLDRWAWNWLIAPASSIDAIMAKSRAARDREQPAEPSDAHWLKAAGEAAG